MNKTELKELIRKVLIKKKMKNYLNELMKNSDCKKNCQKSAI